MKYLLITLLIFFSSAVNSADLVKKSKSGICHDTSSSYYERTKNYTPFYSLNDCLSSGGRLPKGSSFQKSNAATYSQSASKYDRSYFGNWADEDRDCINTRHELLMKQSTSTIDTGSNRCTVSRGRWLDPYTGKTFYEARQVDIDHLVPLKWAWDHGADKWSKAKRVKFANDEVNLFAVQASVNRQKGALGMLEWLPPARSFHCQYVLRFTRIVKSYGLVLSEYEQRKFKELKEWKCGR
ncbi:HNH endonuclease family protein [Salinisphaera sp. G21_0]|uniref:HNH endonuclease family protein n=1 Tax=Salinisphaera sp. G21_0 TaxID=2821094 RepID=UPI001AD9F06A|nr:HNH endonuclease family protein [Salinisphaera sp. G21_0]MBO9484297.1 HNH endonuclease [Salinisphaera sp. G21_0]